MRALALTLETISRHSSTEGKVQSAAAYLASQDGSKVGVAARFLSGAPLPRGSSATHVGRATLVELVAALVDRERHEILRLASQRGDLGVAVAEVFESHSPLGKQRLTLGEVHATLTCLGDLGPAGRQRRLRELLQRSTALEVKFLTKLLLGSMRTGVQESRVEEAIALAFDYPLSLVRRANMLLGDIGLTAERAFSDRLERVGLQAFRPIRLMLAHACADAAEVAATLPLPLIAEDKYDGIRAQAHLCGSRVRFYSRTLEDLTHCFPELRDPPAGLDGEWILDGEIVAWLDGRCLSFATLQRRLGRKQVPLTLLLDAPVSFLAFDVLRAASEDLLDAPLVRRRQALSRLPTDGPIRRTSYATLEVPSQLAEWYQAAISRGNEGAVFKDPESCYRPGARGRAWVKLKRAVGTLDVVITGAEYSRGKRSGMLSDLIFAVRAGDGFVDSGRAYSGLTDAEMRDLTIQLQRTSVVSEGSVQRVEPTVVLEVAFDDIQRSDRHPSGYALRFPRILRRRMDLAPTDVSSLADLRRLHRQGTS